MSSNVTLKQIAESLGVSAMTVSRALNDRSNVDEKTKQRVLEAAREMGYTPNHIAKSLVSSKTDTIGVVIPEIAHSFFAQAIQGIEEEIFDNGYQLILTHSAENEKREFDALQTLLAKRVDGILVSSAEDVHNHDLYKKIIESDTAFVFFDRCINRLGASCVSVNDRESARELTSHLIRHGYQRIAHLHGPLNVSIGRERLEGYKTALREHDIPIDEDLIIETGLHEKGGYKAMEELMELTKPDFPQAIFAVNDPAAFGVMDAIFDFGLRVPDDIAVVGFSDDIRAKLLKTPLTTVLQPAYELGRRAARKLLAHIENKTEPVENIQLTTSLKIRSSCGCDV